MNRNLVFWGCLAVWIGFFLLIPKLHAQCLPIIHLHTFDNPIPVLRDNFGTSVAIDDGIIVVGEQYNDTMGFSASGAAHLYDVTTGAFLRTLTHPAPDEGDHMGRAVAISGTNVVVGAPRANDEDGGSALVFDTITGNLLFTLDDPTPSSIAGFGTSVSISGDTLVVGAPFDAFNGRVFVFSAASGTLELEIPCPSPSVQDEFGYAVSVSGNLILASERQDDAGGFDVGTAYVFEATSGTLVSTFHNPSPTTYDLLGESVAISGNIAVVGVPTDDLGFNDSGLVYVFDALSGTLISTLLNPFPADSDEFGYSVAISGEQVLVGAYLDTAGGTDVGRCYLFDALSGVLIATINNPQPVAHDRFGNAVAIDGSFAVVGAYRNTDSILEAGAAYAFTCPPNSATQWPLYD